MRNKKQTAVEWLVKEFNLESFPAAINLALSMEKEQIINAYDAGTFFLEGEDYFENTFKNVGECDFNYYEIRAGKCQHAKIVHGKIICELKC
jgi:hypothetical protein